MPSPSISTRLARSLAALALLGLTSTCGNDSPHPALVVWIEVDTLRADALGCYGNTTHGENHAAPSPNVDALARDGVRFERAYSAAPWTIPSLVTQLSGKWPWEHGDTHLLEPVVETHAELVPLLASRGVRTAGVMNNFVATEKYGFSHGFELWDESHAQGHLGSFAHEALDRLVAMGDELRASAPNGMLLFGWLFEPHYRYEAHAGLHFGPGFDGTPAYVGPLKGDEELDALLARRATLDASDRAFLRGNYQSEVASVDRALGELVAALKERKLYDDAWIVFVADHGEEVLDRGWIGHSVTLHEELVRVPLVVKPPASRVGSRRGAVVKEAVSLVDLPATIHAMATGREPDRAKLELGHSRSLVPTILEGRAPERRWLYLHTDFTPVVKSGVADDKRAHAWGVVDARTNVKWIVDRKDGVRAELYDLHADPREEHDLARDPSRQKSLRSFQRLRALTPDLPTSGLLAPSWMPEEPWRPRTSAPGDADALGPGFGLGGDER